MPTWAELREESDRIEGEAYEAAKSILQQIKDKCAAEERLDSPFQREFRKGAMNEYSKVVEPYLNKAMRVRAESWKVAEEIHHRGKSNA